MRKLIALSAALLGVTLFGVASPPSSGSGSSGAGRPSGLSPAEAQDLLLMREEEKLARDVYLGLKAEHGRRVFANISRSEQRHMNAMLGLLDAHGLEDPVLGPGKFSDSTLQELHDTLLAKGRQSVTAALQVGALIEEVDIADLAAAMERTDRADICRVYGNLLGASERHLRAFVRNFEAVSGERYEAQRLPPERVDSILGR